MESRLIFLHREMLVEIRSDGEGYVSSPLVVGVQARRGILQDPIGTNGGSLTPRGEEGPRLANA
jgi:hypothetical protein